MSPLEPLAPDQRAVVALVLQQGRSYEEIAGLLGMPVDAVRARAHAGLASLARDNGLPGEVTEPIADYLLGQQASSDADATRGLLADSAPARAWASEVAARLADVAPRGLPEIPGAAAERDVAAGAPAAPPGPRPRPVREAPPTAADAPPASSRLGGAVLIAAVLAVVAIVAFVALSGGDDDSQGEQAAASPTPTATAAAAPEPVATIPLRSTTGGDARGTLSLYLEQGQLLFALEAQDVPPSAPRASYAVWFTGPGGKARRLGFTNPVGADGRLGIQGPSDNDLAAFPKLYATHERVVVSEETSEDARRPGKVILSGRLPKG
jgi:Sigma-70, region 4